jgi:hypothetical protein
MVYRDTASVKQRIEPPLYKTIELKGWGNGENKILASGTLGRDHGLVRRPRTTVSVWRFISAHRCRYFVFFIFFLKKNNPIAAVPSAPAAVLGE